MKSSSICRNYCEKTGACLLDVIDSTEPDTQEDLIEDLQVAMPNRARTFRKVYREVQEEGNELFDRGNIDGFTDERSQNLDKIYDEGNADLVEDRFIWNDSVKCSKVAGDAGAYVIYTEIDLNNVVTTVEEIE